MARLPVTPAHDKQEESANLIRRTDRCGWVFWPGVGKTGCSESIMRAGLGLKNQAEKPDRILKQAIPDLITGSSGILQVRAVTAAR